MTVRLPSASVGSRSDGGFVLAFVVFMLFAISVTAATGYLVVNSEFSMAKHSSDGAEALAVARAGLERFVAEQIGVVDDSVSYALGNGVALVTTRKLFAADSVTDYYYVRSEATVADIFAPSSPATRVVGGYAIHRKRPLPHHAAVMISANLIDVSSGGTARGIDANNSSDCQGGGADQITGAIGLSSFSESPSSAIQGTPETRVWSGGYTQMLDSIGIRWDVLMDPDFPVDYHNSWPNWASLPADSFPVVRQTGWVYTNEVGRGVLIVPGTFDPGSSFQWDGIVIAGWVDDYIQGTIRGLLVGGLTSNNSYPTVYVYTDVEYHSCNAYAANESLSYLELIENTIFESY